MDYSRYIATIPNYPKEGIMFRDVTPLLKDAEAFKSVINELVEFAKEVGAEIIVGPEARGFIFGSALAAAGGFGFVPVRKPNKLPREYISAEYQLEYGTNTLCIHKEDIKPGEKILIVDDLLATGGTINAAIELINQLGGVVVGCAFVIELVDLKGRENIIDVPVKSLVTYEGE